MLMLMVFTALCMMPITGDIAKMRYQNPFKIAHGRYPKYAWFGPSYNYNKY